MPDVRRDQQLPCNVAGNSLLFVLSRGMEGRGITMNSTVYSSVCSRMVHLVRWAGNRWGPGFQITQQKFTYFKSLFEKEGE